VPSLDLLSTISNRKERKEKIIIIIIIIILIIIIIIITITIIIISHFGSSHFGSRLSNLADLPSLSRLNALCSPSTHACGSTRPARGASAGCTAYRHRHRHLGGTSTDTDTDTSVPREI